MLSNCVKCRKNAESKNSKVAITKTWVSQYIYQNELDKACFQHEMAYGDSDKILYDKAFNIAKNPKYDGYQRGLASIVYKFFDKKTSGSGI